VIVLDKILIGGIKFVLGKVAAAVDAELNDDTRLREELLAAQMRLELGEISAAEFAQLEAEMLGRLREVRERQLGEAARPMKPGEFKVTGVEASIHGDET
jgi:Gas vesicle protein G